MSTQFLAKMFSAYIGIDLGTANCLVFVRDRQSWQSRKIPVK